MSKTGQSGCGIYHEVKQILIEHDPVFASLEEEKRLGWESKDVERLWQLRTEKLTLLNEASKKNRDLKKATQKPENPYGALAGSSDEDGAEEPGRNLSVTGQKLIRAGKGPSYDKYYDFYTKLFSGATEHADIFKPASKRFMDIGCAPGGLCAYFIKDLGWSGVGFTLQIERGGLKVRFKDPSLHVSHCDMSEMDSVNLIDQTVAGQAKFDFINCGVVMGKHQVESIGEDRETALQILRVNRNQFLAALKWLADGGDLFWVFQSSSIGCWFYFLKKLQKVFRKKISLYSTLVPSRSPVYAICADFDSAAAAEWIAELGQTTEFTDEHIAAWNVTSWAEAGPLIATLREDLYKIWTTQRDGLREIREAASSQLEQEENLLKKLSGSRRDFDNPRKQRAGDHDDWHRKSNSSSQGDWRRQPAPVVPADTDGWQTAAPAAKPSPGRFNRGGRSSTSQRSAIDSEESWRQ